MNKLSKYSARATTKQFKSLIQYIFDDFETVEEDYIDHDEVRIQAVAEVTLEIAKEALEEAGIECIQPDELVGVWMIEGSRSNSNGFYWDLVDEVVKVHEVTETIIVTKWKPIDDSSCSQEAQSCAPCSKK